MRKSDTSKIAKLGTDKQEQLGDLLARLGEDSRFINKLDSDQIADVTVFVDDTGKKGYQTLEQFSDAQARRAFFRMDVEKPNKVRRNIVEKADPESYTAKEIQQFAIDQMRINDVPGFDRVVGDLRSGSESSDIQGALYEARVAASIQQKRRIGELQKVYKDGTNKELEIDLMYSNGNPAEIKNSMGAGEVIDRIQKYSEKQSDPDIDFNVEGDKLIFYAPPGKLDSNTRTQVEYELDNGALDGYELDPQDFEIDIRTLPTAEDN